MSYSILSEFHVVEIPLPTLTAGIRPRYYEKIDCQRIKMRAWEILRENRRKTDDELSDQEKQERAYMEGNCVKLAVALNTLDPDRFKIGCIHEFTISPNHDIPMDDSDLGYLSKSELKKIFSNPHHWVMEHAFVHDLKTDKWIDARGAHNHIQAIVNVSKPLDPNFKPSDSNGINDSPTSKIRYPISQHDIRQMNLGTEFGGQDLDLGPESLRKALLYAKTYLGIDVANQDEKLKTYKPAKRNPYNQQQVSNDDDEIPDQDELPDDGDDEWPN